MSESAKGARVRQILAAVKLLATEYYALTGKPLGVTGEIAEYAAAEALGRELVPARTEGYDATRTTAERTERIQIKGRACGDKPKRGQRLGAIRRGSPCDADLLVLLDDRTLELREMWEASALAVEERLAVGGSEARARGALRVSEFKRLGKRVWPM